MNVYLFNVNLLSSKNGVANIRGKISKVVVCKKHSSMKLQCPTVIQSVWYNFLHKNFKKWRQIGVKYPLSLPQSLKNGIVVPIIITSLHNEEKKI